MSDYCEERSLIMLLPDQVLRSVLYFLGPIELAYPCSVTCKRLCCEAEQAALHIVQQLRERYHWVAGVLDDVPSAMMAEYGASSYAYTSRGTALVERSTSSSSGSSPSNTSHVGLKISNMKQLLHQLTGRFIILVGGNSESQRVDALDMTTNKWIELSSTAVGREVFFEVLWYEGFIYVFCGLHNSSYGSVERYNPLSNRWTSVPNLPGRLAAVVGAILDNKMYILGGYDWHSAEYSDKFFCYDETASRWVQHPEYLRQGRSSHAAVTYRGKIWVAGGILDVDPSEGNDTVEIFDPEVGYWVPGPTLGARRFRLRLFVVNDELYAVGGDRDERGRLIVQTIEKLDAGDMRSWSHVTSFPCERRGFLSSVVGDVIYAIGGRTGEVPLGDWDAYNTRTGEWLSEVAAAEGRVEGVDRLMARTGVVGGRAVTSHEDRDLHW